MPSQNGFLSPQGAPQISRRERSSPGCRDGQRGRPYGLNLMGLVILLLLSSCQTTTLSKKSDVANATTGSASAATAKKLGRAERNTDPPPTGTTVATTPLKQVLTITAKVHYRLRYYGEEIKTTLQPQKQQALFDDVRQTVHPAGVQITQLQPQIPANQAATVSAMLAVLNELDQALARHDREAIRQTLRRFNPAYQALQAKAASEP
jgi:hypothetical protein